jgi:hypothetical protein
MNATRSDVFATLYFSLQFIRMGYVIDDSSKTDKMDGHSHSSTESCFFFMIHQNYRINVHIIFVIDWFGCAMVERWMWIRIRLNGYITKRLLFEFIIEYYLKRRYWFKTCMSNYCELLLLKGSNGYWCGFLIDRVTQEVFFFFLPLSH